MVSNTATVYILLTIKEIRRISLICCRFLR